MGGASNDQGQLTVGLDVSDKHVHYCFLDPHGNVGLVAKHKREQRHKLQEAAKEDEVEGSRRRIVICFCTI